MTLSITAPIDGDLLDPDWADEVTDAVNGAMTGVTGDFSIGGSISVTGKCPGTMIGRAERTTSTGTTTTAETGALRLDDISIYAGRAYLVASSGLIHDSSVAGDGMAARFRITTDGSTPTTSSTLFGGTLMNATSSSAQAIDSISRYYVPSSNETLSVILTFVRAAGTGNVNLTASTGFPIDIVIIDLGPAPTDTGVDL